MKGIVTLLAVLLGALAFGQRQTTFEEMMTPAMSAYQTPTKAELDLHLAAFGRQISKCEIGFSSLRDNGFTVDFVYIDDGSSLRQLRGFFYKLPPGTHGKKRYFFQKYARLVTKATDSELELHGLYSGKPGREAIDLSWFRFRSDLSADEVAMIEAGNVNVTMFDGSYLAGITADFKPYVTRFKPPLLFWLVWPDGKWLENGQIKNGSREAPFTVSIRIRN